MIADLPGFAVGTSDMEKEASSSGGCAAEACDNIYVLRARSSVG
jgi:hypothetical protein